MTARNHPDVVAFPASMDGIFCAAEEQPGMFGKPETLRWTATFGVDAVGFRACPEHRAELEHLTDTLVSWIVAAGPTAALQLRLGRIGDQLTLGFVTNVSGAAHGPLRLRARQLRGEMADILAANRALRAEFVTEPGKVGALREPTEQTSAQVAYPGGDSGLPMSAEQLDAGALSRVVDLLLAGNDEATVFVCVRRAAEVGALLPLSERLSAAYAGIREQAEGIRFQSSTGAQIQRVSPHILPLMGTALELERQAAWAGRLLHSPAEVLVAVTSGWPVGSPLLQAIGTAIFPSLRAAWVDCGKPGVDALFRGPGYALDEIAVEPPGPSDTVVQTSPAQKIRRRMVPTGVAAKMFAIPTPGNDGLPGLPVDPLVARVVPNAIRSADGSAASLGEAPHRDGALPVRMAIPDLQRHLYVCGKTGVGKSTLLKKLLVELALSGHGVGIIDPHGDLADEIIAAVGSRRQVTVFDPAQPDCLGLDPLANDGTDDGVELALEELTRTIFTLFPGEMMGPMFDRHSRALLLPLLVARESLCSVSRIATDTQFRSRTLAKLKDGEPLHDDVKRFWVHEFPHWSDHQQAEMITYTVSKFDTLVKSSAMRRVCRVDRPQLNIRAVLDSGGVLVARLPESSLGPVSAWFLGMQLIGRLRAAAFSRGSLPPAQRKPFVLALDEFQKFVGGSGFGYKPDTRTLAPMLDECRKFGVALVLANQYAAQLDEATRDAIFGNVGSMVSFRTGAMDAELLARELGHGTTADELRGLPLYHALARLLVKGETTPVFSLRTVV